MPNYLAIRGSEEPEAEFVWPVHGVFTGDARFFRVVASRSRDAEKVTRRSAPRARLDRTITGAPAARGSRIRRQDVQLRPSIQTCVLSLRHGQRRGGNRQPVPTWSSGGQCRQVRDLGTCCRKWRLARPRQVVSPGSARSVADGTDESAATSSRNRTSSTTSGTSMATRSPGMWAGLPNSSPHSTRSGVTER